MKYLFAIVSVLLLSSCVNPAQSYMLRELETKSNEVHWARGQIFKQKQEIVDLKKEIYELKGEVISLKGELWVREIAK